MQRKIVCRSRGDVTIDGKRLPLEPSLALRNHSPTGFAWGYGGSGPAQLALAILYEVTGNKELSLRYYQRFKNEVVARWGPWGTGDYFTEIDVEQWLERRTHGANEAQAST